MSIYYQVRCHILAHFVEANNNPNSPSDRWHRFLVRVFPPPPDTCQLKLSDLGELKFKDLNQTNFCWGGLPVSLSKLPHMSLDFPFHWCCLINISWEKQWPHASQKKMKDAPLLSLYTYATYINSYW